MVHVVTKETVVLPIKRMDLERCWHEEMEIVAQDTALGFIPIDSAPQFQDVKHFPFLDIGSIMPSHCIVSNVEKGDRFEFSSSFRLVHGRTS